MKPMPCRALDMDKRLEYPLAMRKKPLTATEMGKLGGLRRTRAKRNAGRRNIEKAREHLFSRRLCRVCHKARLYKRNKSGVCRKCARAGKL